MVEKTDVASHYHHQAHQRLDEHSKPNYKLFCKYSDWLGK
jgi:hypothetical protein